MDDFFLTGMFFPLFSGERTGLDRLDAMGMGQVKSQASVNHEFRS
jgi:hypothetical protein